MAERFNLPIVNQREEPERVESYSEKERRIELKLARAFMKNRFPLSKKGETFRKEVDAAVKEYEQGNIKPLEKLKERIPTVEHPRLDLFQDFDLSSERELAIFGPQLDCVQVAKGCRHQCEHCAIDARKNVEFMPFAAVLKIAEELKKNEGKDMEVFEDWKKQVIEFLKKGPLSKAWKQLKQQYGARFKYAKDDYDLLGCLCETCQRPSSNRTDKEVDEECSRAEHQAFQIYEAIRDHFKDKAKLLEDAGIVRPYLGQQKKSTNMPGDYLMPSPFRKKKPGLSHYWDSDPFDYRDTTFLHEDGTPADYGDVFLAHMPVTEYIGITTAGWPKSDSVSQRAAEKIVRAVQPFIEEEARLYKKGGGIISGKGPRHDYLHISVHPFERGISRGDMARYREDLENVVRTFEVIKPEFTFLQSDDKELHEKFIQEVVTPLTEQIQDLPYSSQEFEVKLTGKSKILGKEKWGRVSRFSGRAKAETTEKQWDVMACMAGIHIRPDGLVEKQEESLLRHGSKNEERYWDVAQGAVPRSLGFSLYHSKQPRNVEK
ncbi:MAG: hypothetical protein PHC53_03560 [Patescibacteria group bacterium]|nr:hypothetical protein [Patescibacteria group bacterium]